MIAERDGKFFLVIRKGSVEDKPDGRHCIEETIEKEITELEFLRYKVKLLEADIDEMRRNNGINITYPVCPCPAPSPWTEGKPLWYVDPRLQPTYVCVADEVTHEVNTR